MYEPDARELADERVYAHNVRDHMAKWLHVGTVDESVGMTNSGKGFRRTDLGRKKDHIQCCLEIQVSDVILRRCRG